MITVVIPYYRNPKMLQFQIENWLTWDDFILDRVKFIIVDDGSPEPLELEPGNTLNIKVARIEENIPWNFSGAKNLGVHLCTTEWFLLHDIDYVFDREAMRGVIQLDRSNKERFFRFRCVMHNSGKLKRKDHHPISSFFCNTNTFWLAGGHDEDFSGHYTCHDNAVYWRLTRVHCAVDATLDSPHMVAYVRSEVADADTDHEEEGWSRNGYRNRLLLSEKRQEIKPWSDEYLRFEWKVTQEFRRED